MRKIPRLRVIPTKFRLWKIQRKDFLFWNDVSWMKYDDRESAIAAARELKSTYERWAKIQEEQDKKFYANPRPEEI